MEQKTFDGKSLELALESESLENNESIDLIGMVKKSEKRSHISFTQTSCEEWVDIPIELIDKAEQIGLKKCKDHSHPIMRINFLPPKDGTQNLFLTLLSQITKARNSNISNHSNFSRPHQQIIDTKNNNGYKVPMSSHAQNFQRGNKPSFSFPENLGIFSCKISNCDWCTACIPWTNICWPDYCCEISDCRIGF